MGARLLGGPLAAAIGLVACSSSPPPEVAPPDGPGSDAAAPRADGAPEPAKDGGGDPTGDGGSGEARLYSGGTRLKARFYQTADGTLAFLGWNDTQVGIDCRFAVASDGRIRCVPSSPVASIYSSPGYFKDAACTQRIAVQGVGRCPQAPRYASFGDRSVCPDRTRIYALGAKLATTTAYYLDTGNVCRQTTFGGADLYDVGTEVAATTFVAANEQAGPDLGGVSRSDLAADDGSRGFYRFTDTGRSLPCSFRDAADGSLRCLPTADAYVNNGIFANSTCSVPAASRSTSACAPPPVAYNSVAQGCGYVGRVYTAGAAATPYYQGTGCTALGASPSTQYYSVGAEIPSSSFADARLAPPSGPARVQSKQLVLRGGEPYPFGLRDTQRNEDCYFSMAADGVTRCLPSSTVSIFFYSDAQCTQRLASRATQAGCTTPPTVAQQYDDAVCPPKYHVYSIGAAVTPATLYIMINNMCTQTSTSGTSFFTVGAEIPPASFVQANIVDR